MNKNPVLIIPHIEKTGGTSVKTTLARNFKPQDLLLYSPVTGYYSIPKCVPLPEIPNKMKYLLLAKRIAIIRKKLGVTLNPNTPPEIDDFQAIFGHFQADTCFIAKSRPRIIATMFRDPIARILSQYDHYTRNNGITQWRTNLPPGMSLEEYVLDTRNKNFQKKTLGTYTLDDIDIIGITEQSRDFHIKLNLINDNDYTPVHNKNTGFKTFKLPPSIERQFIDLNHDDFDLYENAKTRCNSSL